MRIRALPVGVVLAMFCGAGLAESGPVAGKSSAERRAKASASGERAAAKKASRAARRAEGERLGTFQVKKAVKGKSRAAVKKAKARDRRRALREAVVVAAPAVTSAPLGATLLSESFTGGIPAGWTVIDNVGSGLEWTNLAGCGEKGNFTGGTGDVACASSDIFFFANYDTELHTPAIDFSGIGAPASLTFSANYQYVTEDAQLLGVLESQAFEVDYSTAGAGGPWTNLLSWAEDHGSFRATPGEAVNLDVAAVAGQASVIFRFRYKHVLIQGLAFDWYAQVDDVVISGTPTGCSLTCPGPITQGNDAGLCGAVVSFPAPTTQGQCGPVTCTPVSGGLFPVGTTEVTCNEEPPVLGGSLGGQSCSFNVTVNDVEPPVISCPADQESSLPEGEIDVIVNYPAPTASDNCTTPPVVSCVPPSGSSFPEGTTPVGCSATDAANLSSTCDFDVIVGTGEGEGSVLEIPTASSIGLAGLALLLAGAGFLLLRRTH